VGCRHEPSNYFCCARENGLGKHFDRLTDAELLLQTVKEACGEGLRWPEPRLSSSVWQVYIVQRGKCLPPVTVNADNIL
jgi:hypothetical protein